MMKTVLCYGDSNTWGYEPELDERLPWKRRWTGILQERLGQNFQVVENGVCGRTACRESKQEFIVNGYLEAQICAEVNVPIALAVVMLGTNDCKDEYEMEPEHIADNVRKVAGVFEEKGAKILILSPVPIQNLQESPFMHEFGIRAEKKSQELPEYLEKMADTEGWIFLEAGKYVKPGDYDGIHLPAKEHIKLAEILEKKIMSVLSEKE